MKRVLIELARRILDILYGCMKRLPVQDKITYLSRQSNTVSDDVRLLRDEIRRRHPEWKQVVLFKTLDPGLLAKLGYCLHMLRQMYHVATSRVVILDTYCIVVSLLTQRDSLIVIQMWHAMGSLKKFGYSALGKKEGASAQVAKAMRMHRNYSRVFCSGEECRSHFAEAFDVPVSRVVVMPLPRLDQMLNGNRTKRVREKIYRTYPQLRDPDRQTIVFAPTFRRLKRAGDDEKELKAAIERLADALDPARFRLVLKLHPLSSMRIDRPDVICDRSFDTVDFCQVADRIILDYSAVVFEVMLLKKPMYFYAYDYEEYTENRDFYLDYRADMPGPVVETQEELLRVLDKDVYDEARTEAFIRRMMGEVKGTSYTGDVADFIEAEWKTAQTRG